MTSKRDGEGLDPSDEAPSKKLKTEVWFRWSSFVALDGYSPDEVHHPTERLARVRAMFLLFAPVHKE